MAALAAHHQLLLSSSPAQRTRRCRSSTRLLVPPLAHGRSSSSSSAASRVLRRAAGGGGTGSAAPPAASPASSLSLEELRGGCTTWTWRGMRVNYLARGQGPPVLLVHGFGASVAHWRRNIGVLSESYTVYAIDLLGFGASDKPPGFAYTMETWAQLILDFLEEVVKRPTVLVGNSVGSLACVIAASESTRDAVRGLVLLNCAGGMNNKAIVDDWRIKLLLPLLWLVDFLLNQRPIASALFERVKDRNNLKDILLSVYGNKEAVDDELVEIIRGPADTEGALDAFVSTVTGPPGPSPIALMPRLAGVPVLVLWGDRDPFTPIDGPVGRFFSALPSELPNVTLHMLEGVGHCPHDDRPDLVHDRLLPWLQGLPPPAAEAAGGAV
ncbi:pheophytinase, chloroplastic [Phragmites australis]|uniref:pheophytinase, chloroplastic n=1 Tax=Phragmites australis TaxID=29695 RepID=UPI002D77710D|nr:pheophytinase, chloroplastic [Phragmites australis]